MFTQLDETLQRFRERFTRLPDNPAGAPLPTLPPAEEATYWRNPATGHVFSYVGSPGPRFEPITEAEYLAQRGF